MAIRVLLWIGPLHVIGGLLVFLTGFLPRAQTLLAHTSGLNGDTWSPFLLAVLGPTIASWGVLFTVVARQFVDYPSPRLWNGMLLAVLVWAPLDTGLCLYYGVTGGVIINSIVVVVLIALLLKVKPR